MMYYSFHLLGRFTEITIQNHQTFSRSIRKLKDVIINVDVYLIYKKVSATSGMQTCLAVEEADHLSPIDENALRLVQTTAILL